MKNQFFFLLLSLLLMGSTSLDSVKNGIIVADLVIGKNGQTVHSFELPKKYLNKQGELILPIEVAISKNSKQPIYSSCSYDLSIPLPSLTTGVYSLEVSIGSYHHTSYLKI